MEDGKIQDLPSVFLLYPGCALSLVWIGACQILGLNHLFKPDNPFLRGLERWFPVWTPEGWLPSGWHALKGGTAGVAASQGQERRWRCRPTGLNGTEA